MTATHRRLLSFVPPMLFLVISSYSQLQGKLEFLSGTTFQVSVISSADWSPPQSITNSAQITLRAFAGEFSIKDFQSLTGNWGPVGTFSKPQEAPAYDYFSFYLLTPIVNLTYKAGESIPLFSFQNAAGCGYLEIVDNQTDPFMPPNSLSVNIGNSFSVLGAGFGQNAYTGNTSEAKVDCPPLGLYTATAHNPMLCHGDRESILVQVFGGKAPYQLDWVNLITGESSSDVINDFEGATILYDRTGGTYDFTLTDSRDSTFNWVFYLGEPSPITMQVGAYDASCNGSLDGLVLVESIHGGTTNGGGYQFYWNTDPTLSSQSVGFLDPGVYTVTVVDANGCTATGSAEVKTYNDIFLNPRISSISCYGSTDGVIDLYPFGLNPPFTYHWSSNVTTGDFSSAWKLGPGTYSVTVTDNTGVCNEVATFTIEEKLPIEVTYETFAPVCYGDKAYLAISLVENAHYPWQVSIPGVLDFGFWEDTELQPGVPHRLVVKDAKGCIAEEEIIIPDKQPMRLELGESQLIKYGQEIPINPIVFPVDGITFQWTPTQGLSCSDCPNPIASPKESVTYRLRMVDSSGCELSDVISFAVVKSRDIFIPNAFSPNHDGLNDTFHPFGGFEIVAIRSMQVFDRWGGMLFSRQTPFAPNDPSSGWDGTARGKPLDTGPYLYQMNVEFIDGEVVIFAGEVILMR